MGRKRDRWACLALLAVAVTAAAGLAAPDSGAAGSPFCPGAVSGQGVPRLPGPPLRFGVAPNVQTGQLVTGPVPPRTPEDPARQVAALHALAAPAAPLVLRLTRLFWSDGEAGVARYLDLARRYTGAGLLVELQLRYHPGPAEQGNMAAWTAYVREIVDRFGSNPRVVGIQVTNEVNLAISPDSSDGSFSGGRDALIDGVEAAKDEARRRGYSQLRIGFNWAYRADPQSDGSFWSYLRDHGGRTFVQSLDWIGLDAYPGTFFPPAEPPGGTRDGMVNAMSSLRCYAASAAIPATVPMYVEENGYPTSPSPDRSYARQAQELEAMVGAVDDFRGTYNVSDYRWFDLRDSDSTSPNFQQQYGLMTDTYAPKPAFDAYRRLIAALSVRSSAPGGGAARTERARITVVRRCARGRLVVRVGGPDAALVTKIVVLRRGRVVRRARHAPVVISLQSGRAARLRVFANGALVRRAGLRSCQKSATRPTFAG